MALTDRNAIRVALQIAIDTEESLVDAYRSPLTGKVNENEEGVKIARRRIYAFKRVLKRYYGEDGSPKIPEGKSINIFDLLKGKIEDKGD